MTPFQVESRNEWRKNAVPINRVSRRILPFIWILCLLIPQAHWLVPHHHHVGEPGSPHSASYHHDHHATGEPDGSIPSGVHGHGLSGHDDFSLEPAVRKGSLPIPVAPLPAALIFGLDAETAGGKHLFAYHRSSGTDPPGHSSGLSPPVA